MTWIDNHWGTLLLITGIAGFALVFVLATFSGGC